MQFHSFLSSLDLGHCQDQQQREALFDLALLFVMIDGEIHQAETDFMQDWLGTLEWDGTLDTDAYYTQAVRKCQDAISHAQVEDYIAHRALLLVDKDVKRQALKMGEQIANVDGHIDEKEQAALDYLQEHIRL